MATLSEPSFALNVAERLKQFLAPITIDALTAEGFRPYIQPSECAVLMHIHVLGSSVGLIKSLLALQFDARSIVIVPKVYSTIRTAEEPLEYLGCNVIRYNAEEHFTPGYYDNFAHKGLKAGIRQARLICQLQKKRRCILVDDGGMLTEQWSAWREPSDGFDAVSLQQTASGLFHHRVSAVRRISVAGSAAKRHFESKIIVAGVLKKLKSLRMLSRPRELAVIGLGSLGSTIARTLKADGHHVLTYDSKREKSLNEIERKDSWHSCVREAEIVLGCTGRNFMHGEILELSGLKSGKIFVSLSSRDVEFKSLLLSDAGLSRDRPLRDMRVKFDRKLSHVVANGGFPINFDRKIEWEEPEDIWLTRGLVLIGILQALAVAPGHDITVIEKLALHAQQRLIRQWLHHRGKPCTEFRVSPEQFEDRKWWKRESGGTVYQGNWVKAEIRQFRQVRSQTPSI